MAVTHNRDSNGLVQWNALLCFGGDMTTITEFIEYLKTLPPETEVSVVSVYYCGYSRCTEEVPLDIDPVAGNVEFIDLTGNQFVKDDDPRANKKYLTLGET